MNRLQHETSPYLLQHAENPVDWYPWGPEALQRAKAEDKPILLSVGYSACHWCHVMAHESFEDDETAAMMNELFVNIKVDREERPDVDDIYMRATQIFQQGRGGWPMTVFLTPDGRPFHAGTYYPVVPRQGMPSFMQVMEAVDDAYKNRRDEVEKGASQVSQMLQSDPLIRTENAMQGDINEALLNSAAAKLIAQADTTHGGLHRGAPKFPSPMNLEFLLRTYTATGDKTLLNTALFTLEKMARGGIYDQIGFGFARYSVDERWLVPHFEKMLYDNAQLARVYLHAYQITGDEFLRRTCEQILSYIELEMTDESGGFYSAEDADSEGVEGKFYVWTPEEFEAALEDELDDNTINALKKYWDVTPYGNFEGHNILHCDLWPEDIAHEFDLTGEAMNAAVEKARELLFDVRDERVRPGLDDKILGSWNGLMLAAYAEAARVLDDKREHYTQIARKNADLLLGAMSREDGGLYRSHKNGQSKINAYLEDYAAVIDGLIELYQTTFDTRYFSEAQRLADYVLEHFNSEDGGGFFDTSDDHETLVARPRSLQDNAVPSGNNLMAFNLVRLSAYTGEAKYEEAAVTIFKQILDAVREYPQAFGMALTAIDMLVRPVYEVAIIGERTASTEILKTVQAPFRPRVMTALANDNQGETAIPTLLAHRTAKDDAPTVYVCQNFVCQMPVTSASDVAALLEG